MDTIKSNNDISEIFSNGRKLSGKYINLIYVDMDRSEKSSCKHDHIGRVAFIAGKKHGGAVWRNSAKRRLREIYRRREEELREYKVLLVAKPTIMQATFDDVLQSCDNILKRMTNDR